MKNGLDIIITIRYPHPGRRKSGQDHFLLREEMNLHAMRSVVAGCPGDHANQTEKLLCFQCAIKNSRKQNDDQLQARLTAFFSKLASERHLDVALLTFGGISGMLERDEFTYQTTKRTSLEFSRLLHKSGLYACAGTIMVRLLPECQNKVER